MNKMRPLRDSGFCDRQITTQALLYTEMVTTGAVIHFDRERQIGVSPAEQPVAVQLGGTEPAVGLRTSASRPCSALGKRWLSSL